MNTQKNPTVASPPVEISRTGEMVLGILGGVFGLIGAMIVLVIGGLGAVLGGGGDTANTVIALGWVAFPLSILGIIGGGMVKRKPKLSGIFMLVAGIGGFIAVSLGYIVAGPLLIIGGIMALAKKRKN